jgi:hypothetical protein
VAFSGICLRLERYVINVVSRNATLTVDSVKVTMEKVAETVLPKWCFDRLDGTFWDDHCRFS